MSKKHKKFQQQTSSGLPQASSDLTAEYNIIKKDIIRVVVFNVVILGALLAVYYTNLNQHYLENLTSRFLHF